MKDSISLTVPLDYCALTRAANMLRGIAEDLPVSGNVVRHTYAGNSAKPAPVAGNERVVVDTPPPPDAGKSTTAVDDRLAPDLDANTPTAASDAFTTGGDPLGESDTDTEGDDTPPPPPPEGVVLANGLPWDGRIHGTNKKVLAKAPKGWKLRRKPGSMTDGEWSIYVEKIEAELRAAMAATGAPITSTDDDTPPPPAKEPKIENMGQLMLAISRAGMTTEQADTAAVKNGLKSIALLGARPDLIPNVVAELGL